MASSGGEERGEESFFFYDDLRSFVNDAAALNWGPTWNRETNGTSTRLQHANGTSIQSTSSDNVIRVTRKGLTKDSDEVRLIHVPIMIGLSNGDQVEAGGFAIVKNILMAVYHFNNRLESVVLNLKEVLGDCNIKMTIDIYDTERSPSHSTKLLATDIYKRDFPYKPTAMIGTSRSTVTTPLAMLNSVKKLPQISYGSTGMELDNRDTFSMFGRVIPSNAGDARAQMNYLATLGVTHLGIIYVQDEYGLGYRSAFEEASYQDGHTITTYPVSFVWDQKQANQKGLRDSIHDAVEHLKQSQYRYFVAVIFEQHLETLVDAAIDADIMGPGYLWLMADGAPLSILTAPAGSKRATAIHGLGILVPGLANVAGHYARFTDAYVSLDGNEELQEYFASKSPRLSEVVVFPENNTFGSSFVANPLAFDSVMSVGIAACQAERVAGDSLFSSFLDIDFEGATGQVRIDKNTGSRYHEAMSYTLLQSLVTEPDEDGIVYLVPGFIAEYYGYFDKNGSMVSSWTNFAPYNYSGMTNVPPPLLPPLEEDFEGLPGVISKGSMLISCIIMLSAIVFAIWTWHERESRVVKASQPGFLIAICLGVFLMAFPGITIVIESPPYDERFADVSCMATFWFYLTGFVLTSSSLFAKTWRVNKILNTGVRFRRISVKAEDVLLPGACVFVVNSLLLILWQTLSPVHYEHVFYDDSVDPFGRPNRSYSACVAKEDEISEDYFMFIAVLINGVAIAAACYQAYLARKVATEFSESSFIGLTLLCVLQALLICLPVLILVTGPANIIARALLVLISSASILYLIFIPKLMFWRQQKLHPSRRFGQSFVKSGASSNGKSFVRSGSSEGLRNSNASAGFGRNTLSNASGNDSSKRSQNRVEDRSSEQVESMIEPEQSSEKVEQSAPEPVLFGEVVDLGEVEAYHGRN